MMSSHTHQHNITSILTSYELKKKKLTISKMKKKLIITKNEKKKAYTRENTKNEK